MVANEVHGGCRGGEGVDDDEVVNEGRNGCRLVSPVVNTELCAPSSSSYYPFLCSFFYYYRYYIMDITINVILLRGFTIDDNMSFFFNALLQQTIRDQ